MRLLICGTRGSTPAPGADFVRYGGHTSCVAVSHDDEPPRLVLDGGTGLRRLSRHLGDRPFDGTILLGHLHWDHTQGLPFFAAADRPGSRTTVLLPAQGDPLEVMARSLGPPHFPLRPDELRGDWRFGGLEPGTYDIEGFTVTALEIPHLNSRTFGYRISDGSSAIAYLSDHSPISLGPGPEGLGEYHETAMALAARADVLVHDAQYLSEEFPAKAFLGHSAVEYVVGLAAHAAARRVVLYHHDPDRTDAQIDAIVARQQHQPMPVSAAAEGQTIVVDTAAP